MSMYIKNDMLIVEVPNSEANLSAQFLGIKDRTVGQYYMSEIQDQVLSFLNNLEGNYYIDFLRTKQNIAKYIEKLKSSDFEKCLKSRLKPQIAALESIEWIHNEGKSLHKINPPSINSQKKYLKLDNDDNFIRIFKDLILGDLITINIQKLSFDSFLLYLDINKNKINCLCIEGKLKCSN